jgi:uncharacterized protein DUF4304
MNASDFKKLINKHFSPKIRLLGWKGSGFHFFQQTPYHVVNILGIQGTWHGGSVCCETAIHFDFIPDLAHKEIDISKITHASSLIRNRLSPKGVGDYHWIFRDNKEDNVTSVNQIWDAFKTHAHIFYDDFSKFPFPFDTIEPEDLKTNGNYKLLGKYLITNSIYFAWLLKEINLLLLRQEIAKDFSELGLSMAFENAESMSSHSRSKKAKEEVERYIGRNREMFRI